MSRHGYHDDLDQRDLAMWRGRVASAIRGKRGQKLLRDLRDALDSMPQKRLVARKLQCRNGDCCALGRLAQAKEMDYTFVDDVDDDVYHGLNAELAEAFDISTCLVREIEFENDDGGGNESPTLRWERMRSWVESKIVSEAKP